jgi:hypothetical protein
MSEQEFIKYIHDGNLNEIKEIYKQSIQQNNPIDISMLNEFAFRHCCRTGYFDILKWLWESSKQKINIHIFDEEASFRYACKNNHIIIAKWLWEISNKPKIIIHI